jgi:hypothetical protein
VTVVGTIGRMIVVPIAFVLALIAAGFVFLTLGLETVTTELNREEFSPEGLRSAYVVMSQGFVVASAMSLVPALLFVIIGEVARIRSLLYYMAAGGASLALAPVLSSYIELNALTVPQAGAWQIAATAGFFGGFVYWLIAGRKA